MADISLKEAEKIRNSITNAQRKQIKNMYSEVADKIAQEAKSLRGRENISSILKTQRLNKLKAEITKELDKVDELLSVTIKGNMEIVVGKVVNVSSKWISSIGMNIEGAFFSVRPDVINNILLGNVYNNNWTLSNRIWQIDSKIRNDINKVIAEGVAQGKSTYDVAKDLERYVNPSARKSWDWSKVYPGTNKKIDYNAQRLARTLIQHAYQQSFVATTINNPFVEKYRWESGNSARTCDICSERDGMLFEKDELPMDHPNGLCTWTAVTKDFDSITDDITAWYNSPEGTYPEIDKFAQSIQGKAVSNTASKVADNVTKGNWGSVPYNSLMRDTDKRLATLKSEYPVANSNLVESGDWLIQKQASWDEAYKLNLDDYIKANPGVSSTKANKAVIDSMVDRIEDYDIGKAGEYFNGRIGIIPDVDDITFTEAISKQADDLLHYKQREEAGYRLRSLSSVADGPEATMIHEYGHALAEDIGFSNYGADSSIHRFYATLTEKQIEYGISSYATTNFGEFFAECFTEGNMPNPRPIAVEFMKLLKEIL